MPAALNLQPSKNRGDHAHNFRHEPEHAKHQKIPNVDAERTHLNRVLHDDSDLRKRLRTQTRQPNGWKIRSTANRFLTGVCTLPEELYRPDGKRNAPLSDEVLKKWIDETMKFVKDQIGGVLVDAVLHMDETTPHVHFTLGAVVDPELDDWEINYKKIGWSDRNRFREIQKEYADRLLDLGVIPNSPEVRDALSISEKSTTEQGFLARKDFEEKAREARASDPVQLMHPVRDILDEIGDLDTKRKSKKRKSDLVDQLIGEVESMDMAVRGLLSRDLEKEKKLKEQEAENEMLKKELAVEREKAARRLKDLETMCFLDPEFAIQHVRSNTNVFQMEETNRFGEAWHESYTFEESDFIRKKVREHAPDVWKKHVKEWERLEAEADRWSRGR